MVLLNTISSLATYYLEAQGSFLEDPVLAVWVSERRGHFSWLPCGFPGALEPLTTICPRRQGPGSTTGHQAESGVQLHREPRTVSRASWTVTWGPGEDVGFWQMAHRGLRLLGARCAKAPPEARTSKGALW